MASWAWAATTSPGPRVGSSPFESSATRGRSNPWTASMKAAPICANWMRCSGRTSTLAPTSSSRNGASGAGTTIASAGRWTPRARRISKRPAASTAPVEPPETSASARPDATARTAWTIEDSGVARTARAGSAALAIDTGASTISTPGAGSPSRAAGPNSRTSTPRSAARAAPRATSPGPRSAPFASSATVTRSVMTRVRLVVVLVIEVVARDRHDLPAAVGAAVRADAVRAPRLTALRAGPQRRRRDLVLRPALVRARVRLLLLRDGHERPEG